MGGREDKVHCEEEKTEDIGVREDRRHYEEEKTLGGREDTGMKRRQKTL